jgi:hypothetical protein
MQKPGFGLEWKTKLANPSQKANGLTNAVSANTSQLNPAPGNIAGGANNLYGYEIDSGSQVWMVHFNAPAPAAPTALCPGGLTAAPTRTTPLTPAVTGATPGRAGGGRGSARGGVGAPGEGVPPALVAGRGGGGGFGGSGGRGPGGPGGFSGGFGGPGGGRGGPSFVYALASDGNIHAIGQAEGKEIQKPVSFVPANANATDLVLVNQVMYTSTINGCGGVPNGVWALDLANGNAVTSWKSGATPVGAIALSSNGTLFVATGESSAGDKTYSNSVVALDPKTLAVKDWFSVTGNTFTSTPVIFSYGGRELLAEATKDGQVYLLDTASLGGPDHKSPLAASAATNTSKTWSPSALATWQDASQNRWLLLPAVAAKGRIVALKVSGDASKPSLQKAWTTETELAVPSAPIVVNGVVFAANNGSATAPAVLYAFDGSSGKELWNSGKKITSYIKTAGLWSISGQVHVATQDSNIYSFSFAQDRHPL